jgi:hypothetical protein
MTILNSILGQLEKKQEPVSPPSKVWNHVPHDLNEVTMTKDDHKLRLLTNAAHMLNAKTCHSQSTATVAGRKAVSKETFSQDISFKM